MLYLENSFEVVKDPAEANCVTHAGTFHADEVMATAILIHYSLTPAGKEQFPNGIRLYRASDIQNINTDVLMYDIGGGEFDHHTKDSLQYRPNKIPYASCGLIWRKFGKHIADAWGINPELIDKSICEGIDARDNGRHISSNIGIPGIYSPPVRVQTLTFSDIVFAMNTNYTEPPNLAEILFREAVMMATKILDRELKKTEAEKAAKLHISDMIRKTADSENPDIMIMDIFVPWKPTLLETNTNIKAVIYKSPREGYQWMLAPISPNSFDTKVKCPDYLKGLRKDELIKLGYADGLFIHPTGFTGGAESIETCIRMLRDIIDNQEG